MCRINIKQLVVSGIKGISKIDFGKNLTIIAGPSDTGKSYIIDQSNIYLEKKLEKFHSRLILDTTH